MIIPRYIIGSRNNHWDIMGIYPLVIRHGCSGWAVTCDSEKSITCDSSPFSIFSIQTRKRGEYDLCANFRSQLQMDLWIYKTRWKSNQFRCNFAQPHKLAKHIRKSLVGGIPTPLKNMKVTWDDDIPNWMESHNPAMFQSPTSKKKKHIPIGVGL